MWGGGVAGSGISISGGTIKENTATYFGGGVYKGGHIYSLGNIDFSTLNRVSVYSNTVDDSNAIGNDIFSESFLDVVLDTFTVMNPTDYYCTPIDSFAFDIMTGLDDLQTFDGSLPSEFILHPPYPNPFNPMTTISFEIPLNNIDHVNINVYDLAGRITEQLIKEKLRTGFHTIQWDASSHSAGIYFLELVSKNKRLVQKLILLK